MIPGTFIQPPKRTDWLEVAIWVAAGIVGGVLIWIFLAAPWRATL